MIELRVFTLEEANALLPDLTGLLKNLREKQELITKKEVEIDTLELVMEEGSEKSYESLNREIENLNQLIADFNATVEKIHAYGCFLKDVELGLVDFYSILEGKVVYLCWRFGEEKISFWHEIGQGYTSRQSL